MDKKRTIIMLSAKRSGSSAVFKIFQKHPDTGVCHVNQGIHYWEANFWNLAAEAIDAGSHHIFGSEEVGHVPVMGDGFHAQLTTVLSRGIGRRRIGTCTVHCTAKVASHNIGAFFSQCQSNRSADASAGAGY